MIATSSTPMISMTAAEIQNTGRQPKAGTQEHGRHTVEPLGGPTTLKEMVTENHDYRSEW